MSSGKWHHLGEANFTGQNKLEASQLLVSPKGMRMEGTFWICPSSVVGNIHGLLALANLTTTTPPNKLHTQLAPYQSSSLVVLDPGKKRKNPSEEEDELINPDKKLKVNTTVSPNTSSSFEPLEKDQRSFLSFRYQGKKQGELRDAAFNYSFLRPGIESDLERQKELEEREKRLKVQRDRQRKYRQRLKEKRAYKEQRGEDKYETKLPETGSETECRELGKVEHMTPQDPAVYQRQHPNPAQPHYQQNPYDPNLLPPLQPPQFSTQHHPPLAKPLASAYQFTPLKTDITESMSSEFRLPPLFEIFRDCLQPQNNNAAITTHPISQTHTQRQRQPPTPDFNSNPFPLPRFSLTQPDISSFQHDKYK